MPHLEIFNIILSVLLLFSILYMVNLVICTHKKNLTMSKRKSTLKIQKKSKHQTHRVINLFSKSVGKQNFK